MEGDIEVLLAVADFGQGMTVFIFGFAHISQWRCLYQRKSSMDVSALAVAMRLLAMLLCSFYAVAQYVAYSTGITLIVSTFFGFLCVLVTLILVLYYRSREAHASLCYIRGSTR